MVSINLSFTNEAPALKTRLARGMTALRGDGTNMTLGPQFKRRPWTPEEDLQLLALVVAKTDFDRAEIAADSLSGGHAQEQSKEKKTRPALAKTRSRSDAQPAVCNISLCGSKLLLGASGS